MCMTYYTVDDLRPGRPGWDMRQFSALAEAIDHYRTLPMNGVRVLGMADDAHAYELIRCVRLFPRDALLWQGYEENYDSAIRSVFVGGVGWISPQDVKKQRQLPLVLSYRVDGMSKDGAYLSLELEPWEYDLLLEQTKNHYKNKEKRNTK